MRAKERIAEQRVAGLARRIAGAVSVNGNARAEGTQPGRKYAEQMTIRVRRRLLSLEVSDISWIQGASQYSRVHTKDSEYLLSRTLHSLEGELDPRKFFRIHRSRIVNVGRVKELLIAGGGDYHVVLWDGTRLGLSRMYRDALQEQLTRR